METKNPDARTTSYGARALRDCARELNCVAGALDTLLRHNLLSEDACDNLGRQYADSLLAISNRF